MKLSEAENIDIGDVVYDPFGCIVIITSWFKCFDKKDGLYFGTIGDNLEKRKYHYSELTLCDQDEICDEYKSYLSWIRRENKFFTFETKQAYMEGFAAGFLHKANIKSQEQLQK